ncbi:MAG: aquaporin [Planctomycetaceae bacterium]|nr:aquaporin [Planctomycetales bacterium]MCB9875930.1 aquaporin [Planctomycetaceae bacterium]MCB9937234.1 aquaporin [Planctomycetaceae bacterium]HRX82057.1 aquaporin [Pirellulaceae bacterium]
MASHRYLAEALGTFSLVFAGTGAAVANHLSNGAVTHVGIALTFGLIVLAMIYAIGETSGAHINPAVTIAFWVAKRFEGRHVLPYITAQCIGALAASSLLIWLFPKSETYGVTFPMVGLVSSKAFVIELILTWLLMFVVLGVSTGAQEKGLLAGVAVGSTVALEALFAGPLTGASMNPARSLGPALATGHLTSLWIYLVATTLGAILAVVTFRFLHDATTSEKSKS